MNLYDIYVCLCVHVYIYIVPIAFIKAYTSHISINMYVNTFPKHPFRNRCCQDTTQIRGVFENFFILALFKI